MIRTHPFLRRFACAAMGLALFLVAGGHYTLLQTVAWSTMVHDFSRTGSLTEAVNKTFDGHHLCPLCQKIAKARATEEKSPMAGKMGKKAEAFLVQGGAAVPFPKSKPMVYEPVPVALIPELFDAPPVPVPRDSLS